MVRINKPDAPPLVLTVKGKDAVDSYKKLFDDGQEIKVPNAIYNDSSVKEALKLAQHEKCCFCEAKVSHVAHGDVEHFRPKNGYVQEERQSIQKPGYYWLAYDWSNLFFACQKCNQSYKKNWFPLLDDTQRARNHYGDIDNEEPLIIDPGGNDDPATHIEYYGSAPRAVGGSEKGRMTIERTGLKRPKLDEDRNAKLEIAKLLFDSLVRFPENHPHRRKVEQHLESLTSEGAEYSLMYRCAIRDGFKYL